MKRLRLIRSNVASFSIIALAYLSVLLVYQVNAIAEQNFYSSAALRVFSTFPIAALLATLCFMAMPYLAPSASATGDVFKRVAFCHYPLFLSWLGLFEVHAGGFGDLRLLVAVVVVGATVLALAIQALAPVTTLRGAQETMRAYLSTTSPGRRIRKWAPVLLLCLQAVVLYRGYVGYYLPRVAFDDGCEFGGDVWEYQSIAVNFARGHGFPTFGGFEDFSVYGFGRNQDVTRPEQLKMFYERAQKNYYYRTPAYLLFLGTVYKIHGVSPLIVKRVQLRIYVLIAVLLPVIGYVYWRWHGLLAGIISGSLFLKHYLPLAGLIMMENGSMAWTMAILLAFTLWEKKTTLTTSVLLGIVLAVAFLIKTAFLMILPFLAFYFAMRRRQGRMVWRHALAVLAACCCTVLPWSIYASVNEGKPVILSTQSDGGVVLVECNNEMVLDTGKWRQRGDDDPSSIYQHPEVKPQAWPVQLMLFFIEYRNRIPNMMGLKIKLAYESFPFFKIAMLLLCFELIGVIFLRRRKAGDGAQAFSAATERHLALWLMGASLLLPFFAKQPLLALVYSADVRPIFWALVVLLGLCAFARRLHEVTMPAVFVILFLNYLLVTLATFGYTRYMWPMAFIYILIAVRYMLYFLFMTISRLATLRFGYTPQSTFSEQT